MSISLTCSPFKSPLHKYLRLLVTVYFAILATATFAALPQTINYQGYLSNPGGTPVNSAVVMTFKLYNAASGGAALYSETQLSVNVANGNFNAVIGAITPITLPFDVPYWLTVAINSDPAMSPRQPLASSPYAFRAASLDSTATLAGSQISGTISTGQIANNAITQAKLSPVSGADAGQVLGTDGTNLQWQTASHFTGNLTMVNSTASTGNIVKGGLPFLHNFGSDNTFIGQNAGNFTLTFAQNNTAIGTNALNGLTTGVYNVAVGTDALKTTSSGSRNNAIGIGALRDNTGSFNIAIGDFAGVTLTTGSNNIALGNGQGVAGETQTMRLGQFQTRTFIAGVRGYTTGVANTIPVLIDTNGQLGTVSSSRRFKDDITDMYATSTALMSLRPVTFHYKTDQNPAGRTLQYGLIAEEVNEVYPGLVAYSADGQIETVMYQHLPPMLLNEFQKQQRRINGLERELQALKSLLLTR